MGDDFFLERHGRENLLIGKVHDTLINADMIASEMFDNGYPNWKLHRLINCGDESYQHDVVYFAIALARMTHWGRKRLSDGSVCFGAVAAVWSLCYPNEDYQLATLCKAAGTDYASAKRVRAGVYKLLLDSLNQYYGTLYYAYGVAKFRERQA